MLPKPNTKDKSDLKVMFVYRGVGKNFRNSVIDAQMYSLETNGANILKSPITGRGAKGYLSSIKQIRKNCRKVHPDIIHSHYHLSALAALIAQPTASHVVSLMGSDVNNSLRIVIFFLRFLSHYIWKTTIVKSASMHEKIPHSVVLPNGVNLGVFKPEERSECMRRVGFSNNHFNIIFVCENPESPNKNLVLAKEALNMLDKNDIRLHVITGVEQNILADFYNAADLLLLTSVKEGSPNVIKEALACNCPIVATDVGDIRILCKGVFNAYVIPHNSRQIAEAIITVYNNRERSNGRLNMQNYDSNHIARKIIQIYKDVF